MKKLISMVMAAAMVVSLVPATAFADTGSAKAVAKVIDSVDVAKDADKETVLNNEKVELQLKVDGNGQYAAGSTPKHELTFTLDGAEFKAVSATEIAKNVFVKGTAVDASKITEVEKDSFKLTITNVELKDEDIISVKLGPNMKLKSTSVGKKATISVDGDMVTTDDLTFAEVKDTGVKASVKKVAEITEEGVSALERELKIESNVGDFEVGQRFELKLSAGFEFNKLVGKGDTYGTPATEDTTSKYKVIDNGKGERTAVIEVTDATDTITVKADNLVISADTAKVGAECKLTVKAVKGTAGFNDTADAIVVAKVVADAIEVSVDEDEDVPVIYSGVNVANEGITDDSDHKALEVTIKEPTAGTLDAKKVLTMELPDGVYVTNVESNDDFDADEVAFAAAYKKGDYEKFEFARRTLDATEEGQDAGELKFTLTLVAEPGFTGDVTLKVDGAGLDKAQEVKIAKFVAPYTVEASQNNLIIDYRNTKIPTNIVVKEAEDGLWKKNSQFVFGVDKFEDDDFENDATYTVDDKSDLEVKTIKDKLGFKIDKESADDAATVTISNISLYMSRNLAAGAYDLQLNTTGSDAFMKQAILAPAGVDAGEATVKYQYYDNDAHFDEVVKEGFVNIITAGRDKDDASFTKKVVVPVGEKYIIAGEEQVALDVPAYISAAGYTMLPVRAVATALGINNNNVLWNQASRTVTILYGQRIITMVAGQKVVTVNGNTIPASATVQIKDGRTFLPMRDLATALGVTDITWDAATKTATMNGNQNK
ncbi:copper amine oxidase N-terminal domain-containing protein [Clostridium sp. MCC345]|uniref:copper amine oxidase N-terminal domain-containing protein n=1 Tax=Clostridium sp. MCC345 TaxID=2592645 RepID=UPI001C022D14